MISEIASFPSSRLLLLPSEIFSKVMAFLMASDVPVHLELFMDMNRVWDIYQVGIQRSRIIPWADTKDEHLSRNATTALRFSRTWWLDLLPKSQIEHYLDWLLINSTCHRMRECGKSAFFREKPFIITTGFQTALRENTVRNMRPCDVALAKACIRDVIVPIGSHRGTAFINLPKLHLFKDLRSLNLYMPARRDGVLEQRANKTLLVESPPKELLAMLKALGLQVDKLTFHLSIVNNPPNPRRVPIEELEQGIYPLLKMLVERRAKLETKVSE